jgi:transcriptional regulator with XRE-family HTH domain
MARQSGGDGHRPKVDLDVGRNIDAALTAAGFSHAQLSAALNIDLSTVTAYCEGRKRVPLATLVDISRVLNVPLSALLADLIRGMANGVSTAKKT